MRLMVTGGCGFLGSNIASRALAEGHDVAVVDNLSREGSRLNLSWLRGQGLVLFFEDDVRSWEAISGRIRSFEPTAVLHLAGQVAMTTSLANPRLDFETNVIGTFNVLESIRLHSPDAACIYSSTNKVYGDLESLQYQETDTRYIARDYPQGFDETLPLCFCSPYGCSKGAADQYVLDYARVFNLKTVVLRHSSIFGDRQFSTYDQGWIGWFMQQALDATKSPGRAPFSVSGTGKQVRDVLFASDIAQCYFSVLRCIDECRGNAFNIGGGPRNSISVLELLRTLEQWVGLPLDFHHLPWRRSDQKVFIADNTKMSQATGWSPQTGLTSGLRRMFDWVASR